MIIAHSIHRPGFVRTSVIGFFLGYAVVSSAEPQHRYSPYRKLDLFAKVLTYIENHYVEHVDDDHLVYGALQGLTHVLDPHSVFMPPEQYRQLKAATRGRYAGVGIEVEIRQGRMVIIAPLQGSPADRAGLRSGDQITEVDGVSTQDMSMNEALKKMRGARGTRLKLTIRRVGRPEIFRVVLVRDTIRIVSVDSKEVGPRLLYVRIKNFQAHTSKLVKRAIDDRRKRGALNGVIIDLRNNPGGLLKQAVRVTDLFVRKGLIVRTVGQGGRLMEREHAHRRGTYADIPLVVLVNEGSASAAEIVAGALQDHRRAMVIGVQTFGKGSVQSIIELNDGSALKLTIARYFTPSGRVIQGKGIVPDIVVPSRIPPSRASSAAGASQVLEKPAVPRPRSVDHSAEDAQLRAAIRYLKQAPMNRPAG